MMSKKFLISLLVVIAGCGYSNNVQVGVPSLPSSTTLQFTIQWDNSWRLTSGPTNWDAVWIFVKYQDCATNLWKHVDLSTVVANHSVSGAQLEVLTVADAKGGVYLRLNAPGNTSISSAVQ